jgi:transcriptional regulator with XRE-family HTH domain
MKGQSTYSAHTSSDLAIFGKQLKRLRLRYNLSQEELAELCDIHCNLLGRIERGERAISFDYMMRIAAALQIRPAELFEQIPAPTKNTRRKRSSNLRSTKTAPSIFRVEYVRFVRSKLPLN